MSEYDYIINETLERYIGKMNECQLIEEVKDWLDAENIEYSPDVIDMLIPQCIKEYEENLRKEIHIIGVEYDS